MSSESDYDSESGPREPVGPLDGRRRRRRRRRGRRRGPPLAVIVVIVGAAFAAAGWYANDQLGSTTRVTERLLLVKADPGPVKVRPEEPGGLKVPNQDKLVYERLTLEEPEATPEQLLPPPEEPLARPKPAEPVVSVESGDADTADAAISAKARSGGETATAKAGGEEKRAPIAVVSLEPAAKAPEAGSPKPAASTPGGRYLVQLGAYRSRESATGAWNRLRETHAGLLAGLSLNIMRADLGPGKGVYYRARVGPFDASAQARALCDNLKSRKVDCFVVRR